MKTLGMYSKTTFIYAVTGRNILSLREHHLTLIRKLNQKSTFFIVILRGSFASISNSLHAVKTCRHKLRASGHPILFDSAAKCIYWIAASKKKWQPFLIIAP